MRILLSANASCPLTYSPAGAAQGGGRNAVIQIARMLGADHDVSVLAPSQSDLPDMRIIQVEGALFDINRYKSDEIYPITSGSSLSNMWEYIAKYQHDYDLVINFSQDWLPYYLMPYLDVPVYHRLNHVPWAKPTIEITKQRSLEYPRHFAGVSNAQIRECGLSPENIYLLSQGIDTDSYTFWGRGDDGLAAIARVHPSKGLADAAEVARRVGQKLYIYGSVTDPEYAAQLISTYPDTVVLMGYVSSSEIKRTIGRHRGLIMAHRWVEAMAVGGIEALAAGLPVITYDLGGPPESVSQGVNGYIVPVGDMDAMVSAVGMLEQINRNECRRSAIEKYGLNAFRLRLMDWLGLDQF